MLKLLMIIFSVLIYSSTFAQNQVVIGVVESPPYFEEKRTDGKGMACELLTTAFHKTGYDVVFEFYPLARLFDTLIDGKVTGIVLGNLSPEEKSQVIESKPIYLTENVLF